jgi:arsenate reductase
VLLMGRPRGLDAVAAELALDWVGIFSYESVARLVRDTYDRLAERAPGGPFPLVSTERLARERLEALAQAQGGADKAVPEILFVCTNNAGRSVMAAALLECHAGGRVHVRSAGSDPAAEINTTVAAVLGERGLDVDGAFPKPLTDEVVAAADVVITMGCGDACAVFPGIRYVDWAVEDPAGRPVEAVRAICDDIDRRVRGLLAGLADLSGKDPDGR